MLQQGNGEEREVGVSMGFEVCLFQALGGALLLSVTRTSERVTSHRVISLSNPGPHVT